MDLATFRYLLAPAGQALLARAAALPDLRHETLLRHLTALRREAEPAQAAAALETVLLRRRAAAKFSGAARMYFTREALEQATAAVVARYRAGRFARAGVSQVADLGCGIGGDTIALAGAGLRVLAVEHDPVRLAMARANAAVCGVSARVSPILADVRNGGPLRATAAFVDPARRTAAGRRVAGVEQYEPPLSAVLGRRTTAQALAVKLSPGVRLHELPLPDAEIEFISVDGDLREAVLWCGPLRTAERRATLLPGGETLAGPPDQAPLPVAAPGRWLLEPDPAVYRAGLLGLLAARLSAWQIDPTIAYLSSDAPPEMTFVRAWPVEEVLPFSVKGVRRRLRDLNVGRLTVKKRGSPLEPDEFLRLLRLDPAAAGARTVFLTRVAGRPAAIICAERSPG